MVCQFQECGSFLFEIGPKKIEAQIHKDGFVCQILIYN